MLHLVEYFVSFWCLVIPVTENYQWNWDDSLAQGPWIPDIHQFLLLHRCVFLCLQRFELPFPPSLMIDNGFFCVCVSRSNWSHFLSVAFPFFFFLFLENCIVGNIVSAVGSSIFLSLEQWLGIQAVPWTFWLLREICFIAFPCLPSCSLFCFFSCPCWV